MEIASRPKDREINYEPIRYINHIHTYTAVSDFEQQVDDFLEGVLTRCASLGLPDRNLASLWAEVLAERADPAASERRKLEAMAGYDPDEAPDELMQQLLEDRDQLGESAMKEVAAGTRQATGDFLQLAHDVSRLKIGPGNVGFRGSLPELTHPPSDIDENGQPWRIATEFARAARQEWGLGSSVPIGDRSLADLLQTSPAVFKDRSPEKVPMPFALRSGPADTYDIIFDSNNPTSRRFAVSRLIGDHLRFAQQGRLLPATSAWTARQKFQRAFAQEFLCPINALMERLPTARPDEEDISNAAVYFDVSPLLIRSTLVNHRLLDREASAWND